MTHLDVEADPKPHDSLADRTSFGWPGGALPPTEAFHVALATAEEVVAIPHKLQVPFPGTPAQTDGSGAVVWVAGSWLS